MSQHDMNVANQGFPSFRADLNNALGALATTSAGATEPSTTFAQQLWYDSTNNLLKMRNTDNDAWITLAYFDQTNDEWEIRSAVIQAVDSAGVSIKTDDGTTRIEIQDDGDVSINSGQLFIDQSTGNVGLGRSPAYKLDAYISGTGSPAIASANDSIVTVMQSVGTSQGNVGTITSHPLVLLAGNAERMRIDSSGNVGIGTPSAAQKLHVRSGIGIGVIQLGDTAATGYYAEVNQNANNLQLIANGDQAYRASLGTNNGSGSITFLTASGTTGNTERMRIDSAGRILKGSLNINPPDSNSAGLAIRESYGILVNTDGSQPMSLGRSQDGVLVYFYSAGSIEGQISVSGSAVTYGGGHLGRWSRLADDSKDTSIVKGTVMTNLNEMVVWSHDAVEAVEAQDAVYDDDGNVVTEAVEAVEAKDAYTEDNEQLNKTAVSSVEGDPNVAGVFVNWDEDDDFNDMNIAMTGDFVIRIAQGTTVARGDLLMSAGDGTAKPQGDDIVRSKTIAKVTSTHVSHTYDDGSYLVPCVLMAC